MQEVALELLAELLPTLFYAASATLLTLLGLVAEARSAAELAGGVDPFGLWLAYMGAVALYAGVYMLGYRELLPRTLGNRA